jgi:hypothetical protein
MVQGFIHSSGGGGGAAGVMSYIEDADADTGVYTEENPDEDIIRFYIAGAQVGVLNADGLDLEGWLALGSNAIIDPLNDPIVLNIDHTFAADIGLATGEALTINITDESLLGVYYGLLLNNNYDAAAGSANVLYGLRFLVTGRSTQAITNLLGIDAYIRSTAAQTGAISNAYGLYLWGSWAGSKPATVYGLRLATGLGNAAVGTIYGIYVPNLAAVNSYLLHIGNATPYVRVIGAAPAANQTNLYLAEGVAPTLRRVQWKDGAAIGAGDRVMVLA